ncbi:MAG: hypothetical protein M9894_07195 [Planctomycetes bacterium]|nr:hypothetical protein [Planctomycetota bacterium]
MNDDTRVLVNPAAAGGRCRARAAALRAAIDRRWPLAAWVETTSGADLAARAREAAARAAARVLVAGGDGSAHLAAGALAGTTTALGVLPLGTGNDLAAALGLPSAPDDVVDALARDEVREVDLLRARPCDGAGRARLAGCLVAVGMDAAAIDLVDGARLLPRGRLLYTLAALRAALAYRPPHVTVTVDGRVVHDGPAFFAAAANTPTYAGGVRIAPEARVDDGLLDVVVIPPLGSRLEQAAALGAVRRGAHGRLPGVVLARGRRVVLEGERAQVTVDGERTTLRAPVEVEVVPGALRALGGPRALARAA